MNCRCVNVGLFSLSFDQVKERMGLDWFFLCLAGDFCRLVSVGAAVQSSAASLQSRALRTSSLTDGCKKKKRSLQRVVKMEMVPRVWNENTLHVKFISNLLGKIRVAPDFGAECKLNQSLSPAQWASPS